MTAVQGVVRPAPSPGELLGRVRADVYRLAITTFAPVDPLASRSLRRSRPTREPLLTELRGAIRPGLSGDNSAKGGGASLPFDPTALELLEDLQTQIAGIFMTAVPEREHHVPGMTSEMLLLEWLREFEDAFHAGEVNDAMLDNYRSKVAGWRRRVEDLFDPPRRVEYPLCPRCGYTHALTVVDGELIQSRAVTLIYRPTNHSALAECKHCGASWRGFVYPSGLKTDGIDELERDINDNIERHGPLNAREVLVAPLALAEELAP